MDQHRVYLPLALIFLMKAMQKTDSLVVIIIGSLKFFTKLH